MMTSALMRMGAVCVLGTLIDVCVENAPLRSGVRLVASLLLMLAVLEMLSKLAGASGWTA